MLLLRFEEQNDFQSSDSNNYLYESLRKITTGDFLLFFIDS
ncbi:conserved hypothetical protein [Xenorhabdus nematophila F1]|uniref:Uncharacterized protein n=1 Tax=Xenorhabdus nematophila (strain ATCC 19061 / DSM 3370 / CCUG 14189 / LMG 1036 / NCIMB 9965 / AN6) TaxID=406817 RepID=D3VHV5_XENNA|nr:hypothetical protein XNC1_0367 [Xenorhabdus nematophila ATCC 19061]CCW29750.1 conserved hypothetical protein [Xenorhabdus nematophila F1]